MTEQEIRQYLKKRGIVGRKIRCFDVIDSTNTWLKQAALGEAEDGFAVLADYQTAGRGRMDRTFQSPAGKGIYLSVLLRPGLPAERLLPVTALAGAAVCDAVERVCGVRPGLKWPNDPVLKEKKLCGVLTELVTVPGRDAAVVLGIGINVLQEERDFSPDVAAMATSLSMALNRQVDRAELAAALLEELDRMYAALRAGDLTEYREIYRRDCVNLGRQIRLLRDEAEETAVAVDIDPQFALVIRRADGREETVRSGEVSVRGLYGYVE